MKLNLRWLILTLAMGVVTMVIWVAQAELSLGSRATVFIGGPQDWINSQPLSWDRLRGKVVLVDFWEYTCVNCIRTFPYLRAWYKRYRPYGFEIIGIHTPEFKFDESRDLVVTAVRREKLDWPILNDPERRNWEAYHEHYWPSKYIFDQEGRLVAQHAGEGRYQETELLIQKLLHRTHPDAKFSKLLPAVRPGDREGAVCRIATPELYANPNYGFLEGLPAGWTTSKVAFLTDRRPHEESKIYAHGSFIPGSQSLQHGRTTNDLRDYVLIRYRASEVNVVLHPPTGRDYRVYAWLDNKPIPASSWGDDIRYDNRGSYLAVAAPRMYNAIRGAYGDHELKLSSDSPEFDLYSYTFNGCDQK